MHDEKEQTNKHEPGCLGRCASVWGGRGREQRRAASPRHLLQPPIPTTIDSLAKTADLDQDEGPAQEHGDANKNNINDLPVQWFNQSASRVLLAAVAGAASAQDTHDVSTGVVANNPAGDSLPFEWLHGRQAVSHSEKN